MDTPDHPTGKPDKPDKNPTADASTDAITDTSGSGAGALFKGPAASPEILCQRGCIWLNVAAAGLAGEGRRKR